VKGSESRSQWPRGLRHELSSLARILGSWVRIPLKAWMSAFILYLCCIPSPGSPTGSLRIKKLKWNKAFHGCPMRQSGSNRGEKKETEGVWKLTSVSLLPTLPLRFKFCLSVALYSSSLCWYRRTSLYALIMLFTRIRPTWVLCFWSASCLHTRSRNWQKGFLCVIFMDISS
jgi:hypothetical protein